MAVVAVVTVAVATVAVVTVAAGTTTEIIANAGIKMLLSLR